MGLGFTLALLSISTIREVLGNGSFAGLAIPFLADHKIEFFVKAPGGMLVYGVMIAVITAVMGKNGPKKKEFSCAGCPSAALCHSSSGCNTETREAKEEK